MRWAPRVLTVFGCTAVFALSTSALGASASVAPKAGVTRPRRLLIVALPGATWSQLEDPALVNLDRLFARSAVADLIDRTARGAAHASDGYATIGAGTRAEADSAVAGLAFNASEAYGPGSASQEFERRTGLTVRAGIVDLAIAGLASSNLHSDFGAHIGALANVLAQAGYSSAVIANADTPGPAYPGTSATHREAVAALMAPNGTLAGGDVDGGLLQADTAAPFATRLNTNAVLRAFDAVWRDRSVVLVEASDLARFQAYGGNLTSAQHAAQQHQALVDTDKMVGELLARVDPSRDAVMVITPSHAGPSDTLGVAALSTPTIQSGYLDSPTTRRTGFVSLVDVAPTILQTFGLKAPSSMEGQPMAHRGGPAAFTVRRTRLVAANQDGVFRDQLVDPVYSTYAVFAELVAVGVALLVFTRRHASVLRFFALMLLGFPTVTYFIGPFHFATNSGVTGFWLFTAIGSALFAAACTAVGKRTRSSPVVWALGAIVAIQLADAFVDQRLEFNTPFGYSATVGIRIAGIGNETFAQVAAAVVLLAGFLIARGGDRARNVAYGLLGAAVIALAAPVFGQNFGAALALVPTVAVFVWLTMGRRLRPRHIVVGAGVIVAAGLAVGLIDLARPASQRTHIGQFFSQVGSQGWGGFAMVIHRKASENLETFSNTAWVVLVIVAIALLIFLALGPARLYRALPAGTPARATAISLAVLIVLGDAFKDSGIAVSAVMLGVMIATLAFVLPEPKDLDIRRDPMEAPTEAELTPPLPEPSTTAGAATT